MCALQPGQLVDVAWSLTSSRRLLSKKATDGFGSSCSMISDRLDPDFAAVTLIPLVTSDLPMKVAPSSMTRRAAFKSPCKVHFDFNSHRSFTVMLPCTLPKTTMDFVLI